MEFELSVDQCELADAAAALLDGLASREVVRAFVGPGLVDESEELAEAREAGFDRTLWRSMADQGWLATERAEADGGLGLSMVEVAVLCEQLGRHVAPVPFLGTVLCLGALRGAAADDTLSPDVRRAAGGWEAGLSSGEVIGSLAWAATPGTVTARPVGDRWHLTGKPEPSLHASVAGVVVVVTDDAVYALGGEGGLPPAEPAMDRTRTLAWVDLDDRPALRIGDAAAADLLVARAATGAAAELLGAASRVLEMTVDYAKVRRQFGHPIGSFQAVKHRLADALVDVEAMRSSTYYAAWCLATDDPEANLAASMAKAWCSDASRRVTASGMQVHGGIGFTWEHDLHLYVKRAQLDATSFGGASWHRDRVAGLLQLRLAAGVAPL